MDLINLSSVDTLNQTTIGLISNISNTNKSIADVNLYFGKTIKSLNNTKSSISGIDTNIINLKNTVATTNQELKCLNKQIGTLNNFLINISCCIVTIIIFVIILYSFFKIGLIKGKKNEKTRS